MFRLLPSWSPVCSLLLSDIYEKYTKSLIFVFKDYPRCRFLGSLRIHTLFAPILFGRCICHWFSPLHFDQFDFHTFFIAVRLVFLLSLRIVVLQHRHIYIRFLPLFLSGRHQILQKIKLLFALCNCLLDFLELQDPLESIFEVTLFLQVVQLVSPLACLPIQPTLEHYADDCQHDHAYQVQIILPWHAICSLVEQELVGVVV